MHSYKDNYISRKIFTQSFDFPTLFLIHHFTYTHFKYITSIDICIMSLMFSFSWYCFPHSNIIFPQHYVYEEYFMSHSVCLHILIEVTGFFNSTLNHTLLYCRTPCSYSQLIFLQFKLTHVIVVGIVW